MRAALFLSLAVAAILSDGLIAAAAEAATLAPALLISDGNTRPVQRVTNVCGTNGCVRVQTQRVKHQKPGSVAAKHI